MGFINVLNVSKTYKIKQKKSGSFGSVRSFIHPDYRYIKAVNNLSFSIDEGETIGFIGSNGAGKSLFYLAPYE